MKVSFYLKEPASADKAGARAIYARICYEGNKMKYYFSESIEPAYWNKDEHRAKQTKKFPQYPEFNARLDNIEAAIKKAALRYANENENKYPTPDQLREVLNETLKNQKPKHGFTFLSFFDKFIEDCKAGIRKTKKGNPIKAGSLKNYTSTKNILIDYQEYSRKKIDFANIDMAFYSDFTAYLTTVKKHSVNYIAKHLKEIKAVLSYATDLGINANLTYQGSSFTAITEETESIYLPEHILKEIEALDLSDNLPLDRVRDLFLIGCNTALRFSDLSTLRPEHISNGMITITQTKTGSPVVIPVHDVVSRIMNKYGGQLPKALSNQKMNDAIKLFAKQCKSLKSKHSISFTKGGVRVTETLPKWEFVSTHTARRSFCSNQYLAGVPPITIMAISGHKTETAFMKYIKLPSDEHAHIIRAAWDTKAQKEKEGIKTIAI